MSGPEFGQTGSGPSAPYGPATASIRRFLVRLAALQPLTREAVVTRFATLSGSRAFALADVVLADTIERSGRTDAQQALAGPLLQIVGLRGASKTISIGADPDGDDGTLDALDTLAEPALAALLALLVRDLLSASHFRTLYGAFDDAIPSDALNE